MMLAQQSPSIWEEIHPFWLGFADSPPLVTSIAYYFDDSYNFEGEGRNDVFAVAGYAAPLKVWEDFKDRWWQTLDNAPHELSEFSASDCRNREDEFEGWSKDECDELTRALVSIIVDSRYDHQMFGCGAAVEIPHKEDTELQVKIGRDAYILCAGWLVTRVLTWAEQFGEDEHIHLMFDRQQKVRGRMMDLYDDLLEEFGDLGRRVRGPQFLEKDYVAPQQAADLLAYETYKELFNRMLPDRPHDVSTALKRLVNGRYHIGNYFEPEDFAAFVRLRDSEDDGLDGEQDIEPPILYDSNASPPIRAPRSRPPLREVFGV